MRAFCAKVRSNKCVDGNYLRLFSLRVDITRESRQHGGELHPKKRGETIRMERKRKLSYASCRMSGHRRRAGMMLRWQPQPQPRVASQGRIKFGSSISRRSLSPSLSDFRCLRNQYWVIMEKMIQENHRKGWNLVSLSLARRRPPPGWVDGSDSRGRGWWVARDRNNNQEPRLHPSIHLSMLGFVWYIHSSRSSLVITIAVISRRFINRGYSVLRILLFFRTTIKHEQSCKFLNISP